MRLRICALFMVAFVFLGGFMLNAADLSFSLTFEGKTLDPDVFAGEKGLVNKIALDDKNFIEGYNKNDAFVRVRKEVPTYSANQNLSLPEGTISFWFKPLKWLEGKPARFLHVFSPGGGDKGLVIFYFTKKKESDDLVMRIVTPQADTKEVLNLIVPGKLVKKNVWQKLDFTWNSKIGTVYLNGEKVDAEPMGSSYETTAKLSRDWGSFSVLPVYPEDGDDWEVSTAMDDIRAYKGAMTAAEIKAVYADDMDPSKWAAKKKNPLVHAKRKIEMLTLGSVPKLKYRAEADATKISDRDLSFCLTFDRKSTAADFSLGAAAPLKFNGLLEDRTVPGFDNQNAFNLQDGEELAYDVVKNINHRQGTVTMWLMAQDYSPKAVKGSDPELSFQPYLNVYFKNGKDWVRFFVYQYYTEPLAFFYWQNSQCDSKLYRVAGMPMYDVGQGQWFQVAITWDEKKIKIYFNGKMTGEAELPKEAEALRDMAPVAAESFIGIRKAFFSPREEGYHTVVDDIKIYSRALTDVEISNKYQGLVEGTSGTQQGATKSIGIRLDGVDDGKGPLDRLDVTLDFNPLPKEWYDLLVARKLKGEYRLTSPSGEVSKGTWNPVQPVEDRILGGVTGAGKHTFAITLTSPEGKTESATASVDRPDTSWHGNGLGAEDTVPAPWTSMSISKDDVVKVWGREVRFSSGPFPTSIVHSGDTLLVKRPELVIETKNGRSAITWTTTKRIVNRSFIVLSGIGTATDFTMDWSARIDFDGLIRSDFTIKGEPEVKSMKLVWTVDRRFSEYVMNPTRAMTGDGVFDGGFTLSGAFSSDHNSVLWLTSEKKGFAWTLESDANWIHEPQDNVLHVAVDKSGGHCEVTMINSPVRMPPNTPYHAMFIATPSRPLPELCRTFRLGGYGLHSNSNVSMEHHAGEGFEGGVFSFKPDPDFPDAVAQFKSWGKYLRSILPYGGATASNDHSPVGNYFWRYWNIPRAGAKVEFTNPRTGLKVIQTNVCPSTHFTDYLLSTIKALFDHPAQMHSGIYYDLACNYQCGNELHGHGFKDKFGREISPWIISGLRDLILRTVRYCHSRERVVMLHDWNRFNPAIHALGDYWYPGEQYCDLIQRKRSPYVYSDDIPDGEYRSELNMHAMGCGIQFLGALKRANAEYGNEEQTRSMCTKLLLNDIPVSIAFEDGSVINKIWGVFLAYDMDKADWHPYYEQSEIKTDTKNVAVTYYQCTKGRHLAIIGNLTDLEQKATVDLGALKKGLSKVREEYEGKDIPVSDDKFTVTIPARHFSIVGF